MESQRIIMNFTVPPSQDDLEVIAGDVLTDLPDELVEFCEGLSIAIEDIADEAVEQELDLDDAFDLLALFRSGKEISPGVEKKTANDEDVLFLYRRPILDLWCEAGEDLAALVRRLIIEELGRQFEFTDDEIEDMADRHHQGLL